MPLLTKINEIPHIAFMDSPIVYETKKVDKDHLHFPLIPELIEKRVLKSCDATITITDDLKNYFVHRYSIPEEKVHVIPNGVDIDRFKPSKKCRRITSKYNLQRKIVLGFIGAFKEWHNIDQLIQVMDYVIKRYRNVRFLLVGEGHKKKDVEDFIKKHCTNNIILTGYVAPEEIPAYISSMDITLAPYTLQGEFFYGSPMKIFEYMACGKPVVANRFNPIEAVINDEYNGFLVEPGDSRVFAERVIRLIQSRELRSMVGERARKTVVHRYSWVDRARTISELCIQVYNSRKSSRTIIHA